MMKKILLLLSAATLTCLTACGNHTATASTTATDSSSTTTIDTITAPAAPTPQATATAPNPDQDRLPGIMMIDGKAWQYKEDGSFFRLKTKETTTDGTTIQADGSYQMKNNTTGKLADGQVLLMGGGAPVYFTAVYNKDGKMMLLKGGKLAALDADITTSTKAKIDKDGKMTHEDGATETVDRNWGVMLNGESFKMD